MRRRTWLAAVTILSLVAAAGLPPAARASKPRDFSPELKEDQLILLLPDHSWALEIDSHGFEIRSREIDAEAQTGALDAINRRLGVTVAVSMEPAARAGGPVECRDDYRRREQDSPISELDLRSWESGDMALLEYVVRLPGLNAKQKHRHVYLAKEGTWIDVHIAKIGYQPSDDLLFDEIAGTIRIRERVGPTAFDLVRMGSMYYLQHDYPQAIYYYAQALNIEREHRRLSETYWRVLVDNLGMAYGLTGETDQAKATFEYGLAQDPGYPMFSYNLAGVYAKLGDLDQTIAHLLQAFRSLGEMIPGEAMPDPASDDAFRPFRNEPKFQAALGAIRQGATAQ